MGEKGVYRRKDGRFEARLCIGKNETGKRITRAELKGERWADMPDEMYAKRAGTFVSIHKDGALRGCIGTILPTCFFIPAGLNHLSQRCRRSISAA